jgi:hypothetical protein
MTQRPFRCPCCGEATIDEPRSWDICSVCGWEDDPVQADNPDLAGGANDLSLNQARAAWRERTQRDSSQIKP